MNISSFIENKTIKGAIFCHVAIISPLEKGNPCKTSGNQKWQGARPILKARALIIEIEVILFGGSRTDHEPTIQACISAPLSKSAALIAWIRKYFIVASIFRGENFEHKTGIRARVFISRPIHIINHFSEEITIIVPKIMVRKRNVETIRCIELGGTLTLNDLIIS